MEDKVAKARQLALILGSGLLGALVARAFGLPIPFLLGSLTATAILSLTTYSRTQKRLWFPQALRRMFMATIGTMIGTSFHPDALSQAPNLVISLTAMVLFVVLAQWVNYGLFRRVGKYDPVTARYAAMPGGLIEAVTLGEKAGGDVETLSIQHFVRIILVIISVPMIFLVFNGAAVGSAAGQTLEHRLPDWTDWGLIALLVPAGIALGSGLKLPAGHLIGPLFLTATLQGFGVIDIQGPSILLSLSQLVVGAGLGTNFARSTPKRLLAAFGLGVISVSATLAIAALFALVLSHLVPLPFALLLISFAPGGVTEMSLVALSLGVNPVLVTLHHLFRIVLTVSIASFLAKRG